MPTEPLSPYAVAKLAAENYCRVFCRLYGLETMSLRYFNVFGPRQDPKGAYAAVIPRWIDAIRSSGECTIFGDGTSSRDFSFVSSIVQANLLAARTTNADALGEIFNVGAGGRTSLNELYELIYRGVREIVGEGTELSAGPQPVYADARPGETRHSQADVSKARDILGFGISHSVADGLRETLDWFFAKDA
jgi:UDP-N-acetylglucosamine 4-epimerase